ncbi:MAG: hypothetical protein ACLQK4_13390 [Acidimicrobiales bacterium]
MLLRARGCLRFEGAAFTPCSAATASTVDVPSSATAAAFLAVVLLRARSDRFLAGAGADAATSDIAPAGVSGLDTADDDSPGERSVTTTAPAAETSEELPAAEDSPGCGESAELARPLLAT